MIQSLRLKNFRSYKDTYIEFSPGVNIIIGDNDAGKTNVLRAINLVVNNRPNGVEYRSYWGGDTQVDLTTNDKTVSRIRTDSENVYVLKHCEKEDVFKAFGKGIPEIIRQHLNLSPVNIHSQLDGPFLLNKSAADVAKYFNNAINLDIIDTAISNIATTLRREKAELKVEESRTENLTEKLKEYNWLDSAEKTLIHLEQKEQAVIRLRTDYTDLSELIIQYKKLIESAHELRKITKHKKKVTQLLNLNQQITFLRNEKTALEESLRTIKQLESEERKYRKIIKHASKVNQLILLSATYEKKTIEYNKLSSAIERHDALIKKQADIEKELTDLNFEFKELMPNICPLCNQEVKEEIICAN